MKQSLTCSCGASASAKGREFAAVDRAMHRFEKRHEACRPTPPAATVSDEERAGAAE